jgi:DNA polymerase-3 subunit gamma/tau
MRDSQSLLEQLLSFTTGRITVEDVHKMLGTAGAGRLAQLATHLVNRDPAAALAELENALHQSIEIGQFAEQLLGYFRDIMAVAVGCGPELLLHAAEADYPEIKRLGAKFGLETTLAAVQVLDQAVTKMRHSFHARVLFEVAIVRICKLEDLEELAQLAANLQAGGPLPASRPSGPSSESTPESTPRLAGSNAGSNAGSGTGAEKKKDSGPVESAATIQPASAAAEAMSVEDAGSEEEAEERPPHEPATNASAPPVAPAPPAVARDRLPANLADARQLWEAALDQLEDMTADFGRGYSTVDFADSDRLVVGFRLEYNLQRSSCERPDRKQKIEQALAAVAGRTVRVEFMALASESKPVERKAGPVSRVARIREREKHPMVQQARSMFDAEIVDVVEPRAEGG